MVNISGVRKSNQILSGQELKDIQQPLSKDGYTNPHFDKLYGKENNPNTGTERDRDNRGKRKVIFMGNK